MDKLGKRLQAFLMVLQRALLTLLFIMIFAISSFAATYYVSTTGSDSNACISTGNSACATINGALSIASDGDTIKIQAGNYTVTSPTDIDGFNGLTITAHDTADKPVITKTNERHFRVGNTVASYNIEISYLVLSNGSRRTSYWRGIIYLAPGASSGIHIHHNELRDGWIGVELRAGGSNEINDNVIHNFGTIGKSPENGSGFGIIDYSNGGTNWSDKNYIHHNEIYNIGGDSYQCEKSSGVSYTEIAYNNFHDNGENSIDLKYARNFRIHHNLIYNNKGAGFTSHSNTGSWNVEFYNNVLHDNDWYGMMVQANNYNFDIYNNLFYRNANVITYDTYNTTALWVSSNTNNNVHHNVFYNNGTNAGSKYHGGFGGNATLINNIFYNNIGSKGNIKSDARGTIDNNYVYPTSPGKTGTNAITVSDPMFVDEAADNFNLQGLSPLVDAAVDVGITTDFLDNLRPEGIGYDIGAYEYGATGGVPSDSIAPDPPTNLQLILN